MARLVHSTGELEINFTGMASRGELLVIRGHFGIWDADIYVTPKEVAQIIRLLLSRSVLAYMIRLPLFLCREGSKERQR